MTNAKCVICGGDTGVAKDTPIAKRHMYVVGSGQLCHDCYYDLYLRSKSGEDEEEMREKE